MAQTDSPKHMVLYADDDKDDILLVEDAFSEITDDIELISVYNGEDALSYLTDLSLLEPVPCLIILDVNMPKLNGKDALIKIRQIDRFRNTPVVLFTTSSMPADKIFADKYNAGFITKPLDTQQMQEVISKFLDHCSDEVKKVLRRRC